MRPCWNCDKAETCKKACQKFIEWFNSDEDEPWKIEKETNHVNE